ncbi:molecular chaperone DnaJ [Streptomyces sp. PRB2-1]|uniref:Molecular chaperone DnaJ n=1 Tax=Actinacidiphila epipremni TaxID=2053013 RepID=A0ABX0ZX78_9ACTN|nr:molecular chaperone DnaJ [Actinacidiphila epipremni]
MQHGQDTTVELEIDLGEAALGTTRDIQVGIAVVCSTCDGGGAAPGTSVRACDMCNGRGEVSQMVRSFLGEVMTSRVCPQCQGFGTVLPTPCPECSGDGRVRSFRTLTVRVPAGVDNDTRIRLAGEGEVGPGGGPAGDLYVQIRETPHPVFERRGDDLHCTLTIPMTAAALGTKCPLETLDGLEEINIRPGTQPGHSIPLRQRGVTHLRSGGRGDLVLHIEVAIPTDLDTTQENLLRQLAINRGEELPSGEYAPGQQGLFSRLKDAFNGR